MAIPTLHLKFQIKRVAVFFLEFQPATISVSVYVQSIYDWFSERLTIPRLMVSFWLFFNLERKDCTLDASALEFN